MTTDQVETPYDYDHTTNYFTTTNGDGTVPIQSSFHAIWHGQPEYHNIMINTSCDHLAILGSSDLFTKVIRVIRNDCNYIGTYTSADGKSYISVKIKQYQNSYYYYADGIDSGVILYRDCTTLEYDSVYYYRELGTACAGYALYYHEQKSTYEVKRECVYGTILEINLTWCGEVDVTKYTCHRDYIKDKTITEKIPDLPVATSSKVVNTPNVESAHQPPIGATEFLRTLSLVITIVGLVCIVVVLIVILVIKHRKSSTISNTLSLI
jgi:hypothetical protein